jgi:hypothetical protein
MEDPPNYTDVQAQPGESTKTKHGHIIAIDFGTTFTGVAHLHSDTRNIASFKAKDFSERIDVIKRWGQGSGALLEKIPTILSYDSTGQLERWGASVTSEDDVKVRYFKLGLQPQAYDLPNMQSGGSLDGFLARFNWQDTKVKKAPVDFAADYLGAIYRFLHEEYFPSMYPAAWLKKQTFDYIMTVPAIWTDKAKDLTREAAVQAGIPPSSLVLTTEPEAAAQYCAAICANMNLGAGDSFLICDAGGGTVVRDLRVWLTVGPYFIHNYIRRPEL